jgi:hypothetical protein
VRSGVYRGLQRKCGFFGILRGLGRATVTTSAAFFCGVSVARTVDSAPLLTFLQ